MTREKALSIKKSQEQALSLLLPNALYIALYIRSDPPNANDFHWAFYHHHHHHNSQGGTKHDAENHSGGWQVQHAPTGCIFKTLFLCVLIHIADIPDSRTAELETVLRERDADVNDIDAVTCRVWLKGVLERLEQEGIVRCEGRGQRLGLGLGLGDQVQEEAFAIGNGFMDDAARNVQPRPVVKSRVSFGEKE